MVLLLHCVSVEKRRKCRELAIPIVLTHHSQFSIMGAEKVPHRQIPNRASFRRSRFLVWTEHSTLNKHCVGLPKSEKPQSRACIIMNYIIILGGHNHCENI